MAAASSSSTRSVGVVGFFGFLGAMAVMAYAPQLVPVQQPRGPVAVVAWSDEAKAKVSGEYQGWYADAAATCDALSAFLLAGIGEIESGHGQSSAPGVKSGLNRAGCCAGPMQFNLTNGKGGKSTWEAFARPGDSPYNPRHAIPAAARKLCANGLEPNDGNRLYKGVADPCPHVRGTPASHRALIRYNAACWYVEEVIDHGIRYAHEGRGVT